MQGCLVALTLAGVRVGRLLAVPALSGWTAMIHLVEKPSLLRANAAALLTLVCGGLAVCALGAVIFDLGRAFAIW